jgi:hypothetical protein
VPVRIEDGAHLEQLEVALQFRGEICFWEVVPERAGGCFLILCLTSAHFRGCVLCVKQDRVVDVLRVTMIKYETLTVQKAEPKRPPESAQEILG